MKNILKKLEGVMSAEDLTELQNSISEKINESAQAKADLIVEEKINELETLSEEYVEKRVAEEKLALEEAKTTDMEALETSLIENLDAFLNSEIASKISDEAVLKVAINETLLPVIEGIKRVFEESHIAIDSEGSTIVKESVSKVKELEEQTSTLIAEKMELTEKVALFEKAELLDAKVEGLNEDQQKRVFMMFENASIDDINAKIDPFLEMIIEDENKLSGNDEGADHAEMIVEGNDGIDETVTKTKVINESQQVSISKLASRYL
jgi:hypothetical protein